MIIKIKDKEYSFDGYINPINSVQQLAEDCYQQGILDAIEVLEELGEYYGEAYDYDYSSAVSVAINQLKEKMNE